MQGDAFPQLYHYCTVNEICTLEQATDETESHYNKVVLHVEKHSAMLKMHVRIDVYTSYTSCQL